MGAMKENPRYNVVCLRVSDEEREALDNFARQTNRSLSELMREAVGLLTHKFSQGERTL